MLLVVVVVVVVVVGSLFVLQKLSPFLTASPCSRRRIQRSLGFVPSLCFSMFLYVDLCLCLYLSSVFFPGWWWGFTGIHRFCAHTFGLETTSSI